MYIPTAVVVDCCPFPDSIGAAAAVRRGAVLSRRMTARHKSQTLSIKQHAQWPAHAHPRRAIVSLACGRLPAKTVPCRRGNWQSLFATALERCRVPAEHGSSRGRIH